jgi:hypothetical protein
MKITIKPDGTFSIEVDGVPGPECLDFTAFLEEELGVVLDRERTAEFYQEAEGGTHLHVGGDDEG